MIFITIITENVRVLTDANMYQLALQVILYSILTIRWSFRYYRNRYKVQRGDCELKVLHFTFFGL